MKVCLPHLFINVKKQKETDVRKVQWGIDNIIIITIKFSQI